MRLFKELSSRLEIRFNFRYLKNAIISSGNKPKTYAFKTLKSGETTSALL